MKSIILSDLHAHNWSAFSEVNGNGINSRLEIILGNLELAVTRAVDDFGAVDLYVAGDIFHTRGKIAPSVLNPVRDTFRKLCSEVSVFAIPGNHDLEGKAATELSNAMQALEDVGVVVITGKGCTVWSPSEDGKEMVMVPWYESQTALKERLVELAGESKGADLIIHAPVNSVIKGIPDTGLDPEWLASLGFRNVFAGHYHDHKQVAEGVYSIGALTHQTWNDVNTKAGWILYDNVTGEVKQYETGAPKFVDANEHMNAEQVDGNYVRFKVSEDDPKLLKEAREELMKWGAMGVIINVEKKHTPISRDVVIDGEMSLTAQLSKYCEAKKIEEHVQTLCLDILSEVRSGAV